MSNRKTLYVSGLDDQVDIDILRDAFIPFGEIKEVSIPLDAGTGLKRGFGFVEFKEVDDASEAKDNMNNAELFGKVLKVSYSKQMKAQLISSKPIWAQIDDISELTGDTGDNENKDEKKSEEKKE